MFWKWPISIIGKMLNIGQADNRSTPTQHGMDVMVSGGLGKGWWAMLGMVTEGDDWVVLTSHFYGSKKGS